MNHRQIKRGWICLALAWLTLSAPLSGRQQPDGESILRRAFDQPKPKTRISDSRLTLLDQFGAKRERNLKQYSRETASGTDSLIEFLSPADVRGTRFLTIGHSRENRNDEQRLFLPALGSVRRIASSDKGSAFMGTELYYYDLEEKDLGDYTSYAFERTEIFRNVGCDVVSAVPADPDAPYSKTTFWAGQADGIIYQVLAYDLKGKELKRIISLDVQNIGGYQIPMKTYVENLQNGNKTLLAFSKVEVEIDIDERIFSAQNLQN